MNDFSYDSSMPGFLICSEMPPPFLEDEGGSEMTSKNKREDFALFLKYVGRLVFYVNLIFFNPATDLFYSLPLQLYRYLTSYN